VLYNSFLVNNEKSPQCNALRKIGRKFVRQEIYANFNANKAVANGETVIKIKKASTHILQALNCKFLEA
jgi:hypothetical protein